MIAYIKVKLVRIQHHAGDDGERPSRLSQMVVTKSRRGYNLLIVATSNLLAIAFIFLIIQFNQAIDSALPGQMADCSLHERTHESARRAPMDEYYIM
jgi:hypothetical protein